MNIKKLSAAQTTNNIAFQARFSKDDINTFIKAATPKDQFDQKDPREEIPKLYTALKFLDENHPDKILKLVTSMTPARRYISSTDEYIIENYQTTSTSIYNEKGKQLCSIVSPRELCYKYHPLSALYDLCIGKTGNTNNKRYLLMPPSVFENEWWKNRNVKIEDIEKLAFDYNA